MKQYYIKRHVCGQPQYLNQQTGQFQAAPTDEIYLDSKHEALLHAAAQAFPGALVCEAEITE